jgi:hypothetical protein
MTTHKQVENEALHFLTEGTKAHLAQIPDRVAVFAVAHMPEALMQAWLQHLRDFDTAHPDCHFEVAVDMPKKPLAQMIQELRVNPELTFTQIFKRG